MSVTASILRRATTSRLRTSAMWARAGDPPPPPTCDDDAALNYGEVGDCQYPPPPETCDDPSASNYGDVGMCSYDPPSDPTDPGSGSGAGPGDPDDPCIYDPFSDECNGDPFAELKGRSSIVRLNVGTNQTRSYYLVFLDRWTDKSLLAMVGRFAHHGTYVDAIYLAAKSPSAAGLILATRAMQHDRAASSDKSGLTRVIRIAADGSERHSRGGARGATRQTTVISDTSKRETDDQLPASAPPGRERSWNAWVKTVSGRAVDSIAVTTSTFVRE